MKAQFLFYFFLIFIFFFSVGCTKKHDHSMASIRFVIVFGYKKNDEEM